MLSPLTITKSRNKLMDSSQNDNKRTHNQRQLAATQPLSLQQKIQFGRYQIQGELGRGGMGVVYKAYDTRFKRIVALKVILQSEENDIQRFIREYSAMARLNHPGIVRLYDFEAQPQPHFTMEYIDGTTLAQLIKSRKIQQRAFIELMIRVCDALAHAHKHKILHRDIKPSNIMITQNGEPKVMDFGLAKIHDTSDKNLSKTGDVLGTVLYMAPEQIRGVSSVRSDIYSIGAVMYEALTYRTLYSGDSYHNILFKVMNDTPVPPRQINPSISKYLEAICLKCIARKEKNRYISFQQLTRELKNLKNNKPILAKEYTFFVMLRQMVEKHKSIAIGIFLIFAVLCTSLLFIVNAWRVSEQSRIVAEKAAQETKREKEYARQALNEAMQVIRQAIQLSPQLQQDKKFASSLLKIFTYTEKYGETSDWSNLKALIASYSGENQKSVDYFSKLIAKSPNDPSAYNNRGYGYYLLRKYKQALSDYNTSIRLNPNFYLPYFNRANLYNDLGENDKAVNDYNKTIQLDPQHAPAYNSRGSFYQKIQRYPQALQDYNQAIAIDPSKSYYYYNRACVLEKMQQTQQALDNYNKSLQLNSQYSQAYCNRGALHYKSKNTQQALSDFTKSIQCDANNLQAYKNRAILYAELNRNSQAIQDYNTIIKKSPQDFDAYNNRGIVYQKLENYSQALQDYQKAIAINPKYAKVFNNIGTIYFAQKKYKIAVTNFEKALSIIPTMWQAHEGIYNCCKNLGQNEKAQYHFKKAQQYK